jgi:Domain of unknown function (DUF5666)
MTTDSEPGEAQDVAASPEVAESPGGGVSRTVLLASVLASLVVAGVVGVGLGAKIEQGRVKDDVKNVRPVGTVTAVSDTSLSINLVTSQGKRTFVITDDTVIEDARAGDLSDVTEGSRVLVRNERDEDGNLRATEVIVLPESTTFRGGGGGAP